MLADCRFPDPAPRAPCFFGLSDIDSTSARDTGGTLRSRERDSEMKHKLMVKLMMPLRFVGSLAFGILLLVVLLVLMALGTFVEAEYSARAAQFILYANPWFYALIALLALNLLVSLLLRFPWKRHHTPFLIVHTGILVLLFGCYLTWRNGEEAQITLPEGTAGQIAVKMDKQQFEFTPIAHSVAGNAEPLYVPFRPGPFSWRDYQYEHWLKDGKRYKRLLWYPMQFVPRNTGERRLLGTDVRFEVLDYLAHSALEPVPPFEVSVLWNNKTVQTVTESDEVREVPRNWESARLDLQQQERRSLRRTSSDICGISTTMSGGEQISYRLALSPEELTAFRESRPTLALSPALVPGTAGLWGEIVLYYNGKHYSVNVEQLIALEEDARFAVEDSGLNIGNVWFSDRVPVINFTLYTRSGDSEGMELMPGNPELNIQARRLGVFGSYWVDPQRIMQSPEHADNPMLRRIAQQRLDFMQGTDQKLYYRLWSGRRIVADGVVPDRVGRNRPQFRVAEGTPDEAEIVIDRFVPQDVPGGLIVAATANRRQHNEQRVLLRVVFDGQENTFWLRAAAPTVVPLPPEQDQIRYIYGKDRTLSVQINYETIDLGFGILLKQFERRTEPGLRMSSHYSSLVDYVEPITSAATGAGFSRDLANYRPLPGGENILISMNRPGFFTGTHSGYRIYQSSYIGPYYPDQPQFHELYDGAVFPWETRPRESIAMSTLSVNDDPGRGWKYFGSLLIVLGSAMFVWRKTAPG